jgi:hypothetical protein
MVGRVETLEAQVRTLLENQQQLQAKIDRLSSSRRRSNSLSPLTRVFKSWINSSPPTTQSDLPANPVATPLFPEFSFFPANPNDDLDSLFPSMPPHPNEAASNSGDANTLPTFDTDINDGVGRLQIDAGPYSALSPVHRSTAGPSSQGTNMTGLWDSPIPPITVMSTAEDDINMEAESEEGDPKPILLRADGSAGAME